MAGDSNIGWTQKVWNIVKGCTKKSAGCKNCYAEIMHARLVAMNKTTGNNGYDHPFSVVVEGDDKNLMVPTTWRAPRRIFVNSMADLLHREVSTAFIMRAFEVMVERAPQHQYQILTKRDERWPEIHEAVVARWGRWPANVLPGVSLESARHLDRLESLALVGDERTVRMVSAEPLLESLAPDGVQALARRLKAARIGWLIGGGAEAGVLFYLKQLGGRGDKRADEHAVLDGQTYTAMPPIHRLDTGLLGPA